MKELFRERDATIVGYYQSVLESEGIATFIRNQNAVVFMSDIPIPEFFPALCVVNDDDYGSAVAIIKERLNADNDAASAEEWTCPSCKETNPGNFDICWSCESPRNKAAEP